MNKNTSQKDKKLEKKINKEQKTIKELQKELLDSQNLAKENWEKLLRSQADMENLRRRNIKDIENTHKFAIEDFAKSILEVNDSLMMGIKSANDKNITIDSMQKGMKITAKVFLKTLEKFNIKQINPENEKFNPENHQAITVIAKKDKKTNDIIEVIQIGFSLNGRIIRPAMVVVAQ